MYDRPWLAADGHPWFARRRGHRILVPDPGSSTGWTAPRRTSVAVAAWHLCASVRAGPLGKAALWALREP
jgi:hypothetical protein